MGLQLQMHLLQEIVIRFCKVLLMIMALIIINKVQRNNNLVKVLIYKTNMMKYCLD